MKRKRASTAVQSRPISDYAKLRWKQFNDPLASAAQAMTQALSNAQQEFVKVLAQEQGVDLVKWVFNMDTLEWVERSR